MRSNHFLAHLGNLLQFADVIQVIVTKQSQVNVAFTHLHFEFPYFVCVDTSFSFVFYQSYAAIFVESLFFIMAQFYKVAVPRGSLSEASSSVFDIVTFALLGFESLVHLVLPCSVFYIFTLLPAFAFVFCSTILLQCVLGTVA